MKQDIKSNELQDRIRYVPASINVIELTTQRMLCDSFTETNEWIDDIE